MSLRAALDRVLVRSPAQMVYRRRSGRVLTVLAYHDVTDLARFKRQLDYVARQHNPLSLDATLDCLHGREPWPEAPALVTFDDGDRSVLERGVPELQARGIPAVIFVITDLLDTDTPPWWREAEELLERGGTSTQLSSREPFVAIRAMRALPDDERRAVLDELRATASRPATPRPQLRRQELSVLEERGVAVGNHTRSHPCLSRCTADVMEAEIVGAHERLETWLGHPPRAFAYPNGDHDPRAESVLRELGYELGLCFDHRQAEIPVTAPLRVSRLRVNSTDSLDRFRIVLSGLHPRLHRLLGRN